MKINKNNKVGGETDEDDVDLFGFPGMHAHMHMHFLIQVHTNTPHRQTKAHGEGDALGLLHLMGFVNF